MKKVDLFISIISSVKELESFILGMSSPLMEEDCHFIIVGKKHIISSLVSLLAEKEVMVMATPSKVSVIEIKRKMEYSSYAVVMAEHRKTLAPNVESYPANLGMEKILESLIRNSDTGLDYKVASLDTDINAVVKSICRKNFFSYQGV